MRELQRTSGPVLCPACGARLPADPARPAAFCPACGSPVSPRRARLAPAAQPAFSGRSGAASGGYYEEKPRKKKRVFLRFMLTCAVLFLVGRTVLPILNVLLEDHRRAGAGRSPSAAAVTASPRPAAASRPAAAPSPNIAPLPTAATKPAETPRASLSGVTPEFREAMDSYEAFFDEYIAFMQGMGEEDDGLAFLLRYAEMLSRYEEAIEAMDAIDEDSLSAADELYYLEVLSRISAKLLAVSAD